MWLCVWLACLEDPECLGGLCGLGVPLGLKRGIVGLPLLTLQRLGLALTGLGQPRCSHKRG